jgi:hypothetical protein
VIDLAIQLASQYRLSGPYDLDRITDVATHAAEVEGEVPVATLGNCQANWRPLSLPSEEVVPLPSLISREIHFIEKLDVGGLIQLNNND